MMRDNFHTYDRELMDMINGQEGIILILLPMLILIISIMYLIIYLVSNKKSDSKTNKFLHFLRPSRFLLILMSIYTLVILPFTFNRILELNTELSSVYNDHSFQEVYNPYEQDGFPETAPQVEYVYTNYYLFFGGYILGSRVIQITEESPQELIDYLENRNLKYVFVDYSYNDKITIINSLCYELYKEDIFTGLSYSKTDDLITISMSDEDYDLSKYQEYIDDGIINVKYEEPYELM